MGQEGGGIGDRTQLEELRDAPSATLTHFVVMAAIVATMAYFPLGLAAALALNIAGIGFEEVVTFGGGLWIFPGLIAWWLVVFAGALVYTACFFPWRDKVL